MKEKTLLIIDGNSLAHRCIYAHNDLGFRDKNNNFIYTGLAYGFITNLLMLNMKFKPNTIITVWDGGCNYRRKLFPAYKLKRHTKKNKENIQNLKAFDKSQITHEKPPHIFNEELKQLKEILQFMPVQHCILPGEEADDVIGTLAKSLHAQYSKTFICSTDHDFLQLLKYKGVRLFRSYGNKEEIININKFIKDYHIHPEYYPNVLAIGGDATDEYKGVSGISEETAFNLVKNYGPSLNMILGVAKKDSSNMKPRHKKLILQQKENMFLCRKLATIRTMIPKEEIIFTTGKFLINSLTKQFKKYKFHSLLFKEEMCLIKNLPRNFIEL